MKKLFLISIVLFLVCAIKAQTTFSVPTPTMEQKYNMSTALLYNNILALITIAKSDGVTAEELGKKGGEVFAPLWDEDTEFEGFVNFSLTSWAHLAENVQIIEQSNEKVVITAQHIYPQLEDQGVFVGSSIQDLIAYFDAMMSEIANHFDLSCDMTWAEEELNIEITQ